MVLVMSCSSLCSEKWNLPGSVEGEWGWDDHGHGPGPGHGPGHGHGLGHAHHHRPPSLEKENSPGSVEGEAGVEGGPLHSDKTTLCNRPLLPGCTMYIWRTFTFVEIYKAWKSAINSQSFEDAKARYTLQKYTLKTIYYGNRSLKAVAHSFRKIYHVLWKSESVPDRWTCEPTDQGWTGRC